ncbi:MAG: hypothetical protein NTW25_10950 [Candidatus Kapabacteria bacterium]|nr:hypothetical protein [Candidatus Kapabacteria bacterium]
MYTLTESLLVDNYFNLIKNWDNNLKENLIEMLKHSIDEKVVSNSDFSTCFGAWQDNRTSEEIINEISNSRLNYSGIEEL